MENGNGAELHLTSWWRRSAVDLDLVADVVDRVHQVEAAPPRLDACSGRHGAGLLVQDLWLD